MGAEGRFPSPFATYRMSARFLRWRVDNLTIKRRIRGAQLLPNEVSLLCLISALVKE